jgi:hypothetical protein
MPFLDLEEGILEEFGERACHHLDLNSFRDATTVIRRGVTEQTLAKAAHLSQTRKCKECGGAMTFLVHGGWRKLFCRLNCKEKFRYRSELTVVKSSCRICKDEFATSRPRRRVYCYRCSTDFAAQERYRRGLKRAHSPVHNVEPSSQTGRGGRPRRYFQTEIEKMRAMRGMGMSLKAIARTFKCHFSTVSLILSRPYYKAA